MPRWALLLILLAPLVAWGEQLSCATQASEGCEASVSRMPTLSLVMDDLGQSPARDRRVLALPGPVTLAILPDTPQSAELARQARKAGKTVMLHMPMAPAGGPYAWQPGMAKTELLDRLDRALARVPQASGVNNHMGSQMTEREQPMATLMAELQQRHLFFLDSRTSSATVAAASAQRVGLASLSRDIFLDDDPSPDAVAAQFRAAVKLAREQGSVVIIGHPHSSTLSVLERELPRLKDQGIEWIEIRQMIATRGNRAMLAHGKRGIYR